MEKFWILTWLTLGILLAVEGGNVQRLNLKDNPMFWEFEGCETRRGSWTMKKDLDFCLIHFKFPEESKIISMEVKGVLKGDANIEVVFDMAKHWELITAGDLSSGIWRKNYRDLKENKSTGITFWVSSGFGINAQALIGNIWISLSIGSGQNDIDLQSVDNSVEAIVETATDSSSTTTDSGPDEPTTEVPTDVPDTDEPTTEGPTDSTTEYVSTTAETSGTSTETIGTSTETIGTSTETIGTSTETICTSTETIGTSTETIGTSTETIGTSTETIGTSTETIGTTTSSVTDEPTTEDSTDDPDTNTPTDSTSPTTEDPTTPYPPTIIDSISTQDDLTPDWNISCVYLVTLESCPEIEGPTDPTVGFWSIGCEPGAPEECTITFSKTDVVVDRIVAHVNADEGNGIVTSSSKQNLNIRSNSPGTLENWGSKTFRFAPGSNTVTLTLGRDQDRNLAVVESLQVIGWDRAPLPENPPEDDDSKTLLIVLLSVGAFILVVAVGGLIFFLKRHSDKKKSILDSDAHYSSFKNEDDNFGYNPQKGAPQMGRYNRGFSEESDNNIRVAEFDFNRQPQPGSSRIIPPQDLPPVSNIIPRARVGSSIRSNASRIGRTDY